jgi:hypothetical protein
MNRFFNITDGDIDNFVNMKHSKNTKQVNDGAFNVLNHFFVRKKPLMFQNCQNTI